MSRRLKRTAGSYITHCLMESNLVSVEKCEMLKTFIYSAVANILRLSSNKQQNNKTVNIIAQTVERMLTIDDIFREKRQ